MLDVLPMQNSELNTPLPHDPILTKSSRSKGRSLLEKRTRAQVESSEPRLDRESSKRHANQSGHPDQGLTI